MQVLLDLPPHKTAEITGIQAEPSLVRRLKDMGFYIGATVEVVGRAPFSGPIIVRIEGATFALREGEAGCIQIQV